MLTPMSATLKIGNHWKSMKSITEPCNHPSPRNSRSQRLPIAPTDHEPGGDRDDATGACRADRQRDQTTTTRATSPMIGPMPWPVEKAIPLLNGQVPLQRPDDVTSGRAGECAERPALGELVEHDDDHRGDRERDRHAADGDVPRARNLGAIGFVGVVHVTVAHRRPIPPTFSSTSTVAHGIASRRSRGIGRPDSIE